MFLVISDQVQLSLVRTPRTLERCAMPVGHTDMVVQWRFKISLVHSASGTRTGDSPEYQRLKDGWRLARTIYV
jgi:hypothetical protein